MGYIRFLLAALVVMAHCNTGEWTIGDVAAVQMFFLISGFYMAATYSKNYEGPHRAISFFASRYTRLYPMYLALVLMTGFVWFIGSGALHLNTTHLFDYFAVPDPAKPHFSVWTLLFQDVVGAKEITNLPVRQSWSISAELAFYAMVPLLFQLRKSLLLWIAAASFLLKFALFYTFGFAASYFPFYANLGYFTLGMWLYFNRDKVTFSPRTAKLMTVAFACYLLIAHNSGFETNIHVWQHFLLIAATMIVVPSCFANVNDRWSQRLGDLSYGVYIAQLLGIELLTGTGAISVETFTPIFPAGIIRVTLVLLFSTAIAVLFEHTIQVRIDSWRRSFFSKGAKHPFLINPIGGDRTILRETSSVEHHL